MNYIKTLTQQKWSLLLALYLGIFLNLPIFYRRFDGFLTKSTVTNWLTAVTEVVAIVLLTFFLMRLLSLGGKWFYRVLATLIVLISVAAAYYMAFFNVHRHRSLQRGDWLPFHPVDGAGQRAAAVNDLA